MKKKIVIKFSGKVFAMENVKLLKDYARFLVKISKTYQPIIVAGGGKIARHYITHARSSGADESTLDELGIDRRVYPCEGLNVVSIFPSDFHRATNK